MNLGQSGQVGGVAEADARSRGISDIPQKVAVGIIAIGIGYRIAVGILFLPQIGVRTDSLFFCFSLLSVLNHANIISID